MTTRTVTAAGVGDYPSRWAMAWFGVRAKGLQLVRLLKNAVNRPARLGQASLTDYPHVLVESVSPLDTCVDPREWPFFLGKIHNLRVACRRINGRLLPAGGTFSFWRQVGPPWRWRGFVVGREVRQGCIVPSVGGGLCQLSGSLLELALSAGFDVLERHGHTALPADVPHNPQRDATLFWNYVDLRFRADRTVLIEAVLTRDALVVRLRSRQPPDAAGRGPVLGRQLAGPAPERLQSCLACGVHECARCVTCLPAGTQRTRPRVAYLLDYQFQPEFDAWVRAQRGPGDSLHVPYRRPGERRGGPDADGQRISTVPGFRVHKSLALRLAVMRRQTVAQAHFALAGVLARRYARRIAHDVEHLCISQSLLPHLQQLGVLGGRSYDVLMTRAPLAVLERELDVARQRYAESRTLAEFRSPPGFAAREMLALNAARRIITPHGRIAADFGQSLRLSWSGAGAASVAARPTSPPRAGVVFAGPSLARKGAYAVRDVVRRMGFSLVVLGTALEEKGFWDGLPVTLVEPDQLNWSGVHTMLQPALFDFWPRHLLRARAAGARLVISPGCGIDEDREAGVYHVPFGDPDALFSALESMWSLQQ